MRLKVSALLSVAALVVAAWAGDSNTGTAAPFQPIVPAYATSEGPAPSGSRAASGDVPPGWQPRQSPPTEGPGPTCGWVSLEESNRRTPPTDWEDDKLVYSGDLQSPPASTERMMSQDYGSNGEVYAAFVTVPGDTIQIYKSTNGGVTWSYVTWVAHAGWVLSSPELIVAEGDEDYCFLLFKSTAGDGDIYALRWNLSGGGNAILTVKADADTVANLAACADLEGAYYLYCTYEQRGSGDPYNVYTLRSTDYGATWVDCGGTITDTQEPPKPDICYGADGNVYLVFADRRQSSRPDTTTFRVKISPDRGTSWPESQQVGTPWVPVFDALIGANHSSPQVVWLVHVRDLDPFNGYGLGIFCYSSTDNGVSWSYGGDAGIGGGDTDNDEQMPSIHCNKSSGSVTASYSIVPSESLMFTWTYDATSWSQPEKINDHRHTGNFPSAAGWKMEGGLWSTVLYAGVGPADAWFDAFGFTGVEAREPSGLSRTVSARPNPAADRAVLSYTLTRPGTVDLAVYNSAGREVGRLAQGVVPAGDHVAVWDCSRAPAGVYVCRLAGPDGVAATRLVVAR